MNHSRRGFFAWLAGAAAVAIAPISAFAKSKKCLDCNGAGVVIFDKRDAVDPAVARQLKAQVHRQAIPCPVCHPDRHKAAIQWVTHEGPRFRHPRDVTRRK